MTMLMVQKYGGTSLGDSDKIRSAARRAAELKGAGHELVIVVSAQGDTTDQMIEKALRCTVIPSRGEKAFLSAPGFKGRLEISFSGVTPAYIFCWDSRSNICSLEPVFSPCALEPGEERIYGMTVKHTGI
jgi:hypothetical protein